MNLSPIRFLKKISGKNYKSDGKSNCQEDKKSIQVLHEEIQEIASAISTEFDSEYYLMANGDVREAGVDPLHHFIAHGWNEGRDPNARFSTLTYLDLHDDVRAAGINPFWHYTVAGRAERRRLRRLVSLDARAAVATWSIRQREAAIDAGGNGTLDAASIAGLVERLSGNRLVVSISHDDYSRNVGGVQSCIKMEERAVCDMGGDYLHLYPKTNRTWLAPAGARLILGVTINGRDAGSAEATDFLAGFAKVRGSNTRLAVHSLLGHDPEWVVALSRFCAGDAPIFWAHDYTAICPSYSLQRNDVVPCNGPDLSSRQCGLCAYGEERRSHVDRIAAMLRQINPVVVSPSEFAHQFIKERVAGDIRAAVVEHCVLTGKRDAVTKDGVVRVAFVGTPARHKGWCQFVELVERFGETGEYEFFVFGPGASELSGMATHHAVSVTKQGRMAMVEALRREDIDLAFLWSTWQETFCLAAYESVASGAKILTNPGSGNVASLVTRESCGMIFDDFADVCAAFDDGRIASLASRRRGAASTFDLEFSRMSLDVMQAEVAAA